MNDRHRFAVRLMEKDQGLVSWDFILKEARNDLAVDIKRESSSGKVILPQAFRKKRSK